MQRRNSKTKIENVRQKTKCAKNKTKTAIFDTFETKTKTKILAGWH